MFVLRITTLKNEFEEGVIFFHRWIFALAWPGGQQQSKTYNRKFFDIVEPLKTTRLPGVLRVCVRLPKLQLVGNLERV